jgi:hypothetical protein
MSSTPSSLSSLLSLSNLLQSVPVKQTSAVTNDAHAALDHSKKGSQAGNFGPAFILDISKNGLAHIDGGKSGQNTAESTQPLQLASSTSD